MKPKTRIPTASPLSRPLHPTLAAGACTLAFLLAGCSGGGSSADAALPGGPFEVVRTEPSNHGQVYLNDPVRFVFSHPVALETATLSSIVFDAFDASTGQAVAEDVVGVFVHGEGEEGTDARILEFHPLFPSNDTYDNGGFRPGRRYTVSIATSGSRSAVVLRDVRGRPLLEAPALTLRTPSGRTPPELFRNPKAGGPRRVRMEVNPSTTDARGNLVAPLNLLSQAPLEVRLVFDQALNPASTNVPVQTSRDPMGRLERPRGRIFLEYDDPLLGPNRWVLATLDLEMNSPAGAAVVLRPDGVLPNNAEIRVVVEPTLEDIAGESNVGAAGYNRIFGRFRTEESYESRFDAVVARFAERDLLDRDAPFLDPFAEVREGRLRAGFDFEGLETPLDYEPTSREVILNTDFTQINPRNGPPMNVAGGVFHFRNVLIPEGVTVRGTGTRPMVWLVTGDFRVDGTLSVDGTAGARTVTLGAANFITPGGPGVCGGGRGGHASVNVTASTPQAEAGFGPNNRPGGGGEGGRIACAASNRRGSGGGGGSNSVEGDPLYHRFSGSTISPFPVMQGHGGVGIGTPTPPPGGRAGPHRDVDGRPDNNFTGTTVDLSEQRRIWGEWPVPQGGAGGGGGGDRSFGTAACLSGPTTFITDNKGGGGGGGGGVLLVKALGSITVGPAGLISANGGSGGGGEQAGNNVQGGGGGAGAGGSILLMSASEIVLHQKGETYFNRDTNFSISADGGVNVRAGLGTTPIPGKYPPSSAWASSAEPNSGGFGGMGVVQLMAPPGDNSQDGTNTVLDDNIHVIGPDGRTKLTGALKQRFLAWPGTNGKDDEGRTIPDYGGGGDIRPRPHLLPAPFGRYSRARTRWIWTGATDRRPLAAPDGAPRGMVEDPTSHPGFPGGLKAGPEYFFDGTITSAARREELGYLDYDPTSGILRSRVVLEGIELGEAVRSVATFQGSSAHVLRMAGRPLGDLADRYANHRALLRDPLGTEVGDLRILGHRLVEGGAATEVHLAAADGSLSQAARRMDVAARFFTVRTDGTPGLGPTYVPDAGRPDVWAPVANVQIGFAFHADPLFPDLSQPGRDGNRFPRERGGFLYNLSNPAVQEELRALRYPYVRFDVRFNIDYTHDDPGVNPGLNPAGPHSPRPALEFLLLPYRF